MFGMSGTELAIILVLALLLLGPDKLPNLARTAGKAVRDFKRATNDLKGTVETEFYKMDQPDDGTPAPNGGPRQSGPQPQPVPQSRPTPAPAAQSDEDDVAPERLPGPRQAQGTVPAAAPAASPIAREAEERAQRLQTELESGPGTPTPPGPSPKS